MTAISNDTDYIDTLKKSYNKTSFYKSRDPEVALNMSRKTAEIICQYLNNKITPNTNTDSLTLDKLIHNLNNSVPKTISAPLRTIQQYSNYGSHFQGHDEAIIDYSNYIEPCITALDDVIEWFFNVYLDDKSFSTDDDFLVSGHIVKTGSDRNLIEYEEAIREALADSHLDQREKEELQNLRDFNGINKETAKDIYEKVIADIIAKEAHKKSILVDNWLLSNNEIMTLVGDITLNLKPKYDIYLGANIPQKKLDTACKVCQVPTANKSGIFLLIDMTLFGSAKDVLLIGPEYLYFHNDGGTTLGNRKVALTQFIEASLDMQNDLIEISKGQFFHASIVPEILSFCGFSTDIGAANKLDILEYLKFIQKHLKELTTLE